MELELNAYDTILLYVPRVMNVRANSLPYKRDEEEGDDESYGSGNSEDRQEQRLQAVFSEDYFQQIIRLLTALARLPVLKSLSLRDYYSQPVRHEYVSAENSVTYNWDDETDPVYPLPAANCGLDSVVVDR
ncbi:hypothetical protein KXV52_006479 [Aspergillus fumigatus]|nr:hypothetical protein KXV66_008605 [Aspergillus fumigatus]KAH3377206.1 hypothetical protein KXV52_006479 [Aspergillus fumigatus]KAH3409479.1 hypothetical protein KXV40_009267 [Aspergillus fumigatus]